MSDLWRAAQILGRRFGYCGSVAVYRPPAALRRSTQSREVCLITFVLLMLGLAIAILGAVFGYWRLP